MKIADMHCDTISRLLAEKKAGKKSSLYQNDGHVDLTKMKQGGYMLQNFALFVKLRDVEDPWEEVQNLRMLFEEELAKNRRVIAPVYTYEDIGENAGNGKMSAMLTVEEGGVCKGEIKKLEELYRQGVRMMTLSWNYPNGLCHPNLDADAGSRIRGKMKGQRKQEADKLLQEYLNTPDTEHGLTNKGMEFVERMQELGMIVDVSHMSDAGFFDVVRLAKKPFVASHSNTRAVCPCVRNLTDDMIRALAVKGGVAGLNYCADFLTPCKAGVPNPGTIDAVVRHAVHMVRIGGEECVGLGSDFGGIDTNAELPGANSMGRLWDELKKGGFTERQIDKIFSENVLRVYRETL